jgi:transposase
VQFCWCWNSRTATHRNGRRSVRFAAKIGSAHETLRRWVRQAERDEIKPAGPTTSEQERIKALERENRELRQTNEILCKASAYFAQAELHRRPKR